MASTPQHHVRHSSPRHDHKKDIDRKQHKQARAVSSSNSPSKSLVSEQQGIASLLHLIWSRRVLDRAPTPLPTLLALTVAAVPTIRTVNTVPAADTVRAPLAIAAIVAVDTVHAVAVSLAGGIRAVTVGGAGGDVDADHTG